MASNRGIDHDRTVHAACGEWQIVRYDKAGKWFVEYDPPRGRSATPIRLKQAARLAVRMEQESAGYIYEGRPGGRMFDARVREMRAE